VDQYTYLLGGIGIAIVFFVGLFFISVIVPTALVRWLTIYFFGHSYSTPTKTKETGAFLQDGNG
jgi:hypothetical protein